MGYIVSYYETTKQFTLRTAYFFTVCRLGIRKQKLPFGALQLVNLLAIYCILSCRIFWPTMLNRFTRHSAPTLVFTRPQIDPLY